MIRKYIASKKNKSNKKILKSFLKEIKQKGFKIEYFNQKGLKILMNCSIKFQYKNISLQIEIFNGLIRELTKEFYTSVLQKKRLTNHQNTFKNVFIHVVICFFENVVLASSDVIDNLLNDELKCLYPSKCFSYQTNFSALNFEEKKTTFEKEYNVEIPFNRSTCIRYKYDFFNIVRYSVNNNLKKIEKAHLFYPYLNGNSN